MNRVILFSRELIGLPVSSRQYCLRAHLFTKQTLPILGGLLRKEDLELQLRVLQLAFHWLKLS